MIKNNNKILKSEESMKVLNDKYLNFLDSNLNKNCKEYLESKDLKKIADILVDIKEIAIARGYSWEKIEGLCVINHVGNGKVKKEIFFKDILTNNVVAEHKKESEVIEGNSSRNKIENSSYKSLTEEVFSVKEFVRMVNVQIDTVKRYIKIGVLIPDAVINVTDKRKKYYFKKDTILRYADECGWELITNKNIKSLFIAMVEKMDMTYSYKPLFVKAILEKANKNGEVEMSKIINYFREFYESRKKKQLFVERENSLFNSEHYENEKVKKNILKNPFECFNEMDMMNYDKVNEIITVNEHIWKGLGEDSKAKIKIVCDSKIKNYYEKMLKYSKKH